MSVKNSNNFQRLLEVISILRSEQGCPWDRKQTPVTMKPYLLEETHELAEAIDDSDPHEIKEEIGDLFFHLTFIAQMYQEKEECTVEDCFQAIIDKMIRRHPHVFQDENHASPEEIKANWQEIKKKEKRNSGSKSAGLDVPKSLPALSRAQRVIHRASRQQTDIHDHNRLIFSLNDKFNNLIQAIQENEKENIAPSLGKLLLELMHVGRLFDIYCEDLLKKTTDRFIDQQEKN